eukprot:GSChrysophyteH1.ASY1.ANO1.2123.1 assembled CDS
MAVDVLSGKHIDVLRDAPDVLGVDALLPLCESNEVDVPAEIRRKIHAYACGEGSAKSVESRVQQCAVLGVAWMELYCQENYTGPELTRFELDILYDNSLDKFDSDVLDERRKALHDSSLRHLECDGVYAFGLCSAPHALLIARSLLLAVAKPDRASWKAGVKFSSSDGSVISVAHQDKVSPMFQRASDLHICYNWLNARVVMVHARMMHSISPDSLPTLWKESQDCFDAAADAYRIRSYGAEEPEATYALITQLWLEMGLSWHHFNYKDQGKAAFLEAKRAAGLQTILTGALGRRTKYQQKDYAQMILLAQSAFLKGRDAGALVDPNAGKITDEHNIIKGGGLSGLDLEDVNPNGLPRHPQNSEQLAFRQIDEGDELDGDEAARKSIAESGPKYKEHDIEEGLQLHPIDQAVVLGLCLDVGNSNADDSGGLTREEKFPYLQRVLKEAKSWMIHSTGLLERSWIEFEKNRTADRAMLQIQALLDQHTTKLTVMQSTFKSVKEDSAPSHERLMYLHCLAYPAQYELKRDLAQRYLRCQVFNSALNYFRELEMWDEVVACYQLMDKPHRAELVVRERLEVSRTPYMVCALADLTNDEELYEQAWEISGNRFARAKRTLGKIRFDKGDYAGAVEHLSQALAISPMVATSWFLKGTASMRLEEWQMALESFTICVQQDMELGEAYANSGSIHMHLKDYQKALSAFEQAYKYKRDSWRLLENMMVASLRLNKFQECISYMNTLLGMRERSERPVHKDELRRLCFMSAALDMRSLLDDDDQDIIIVSDANMNRTCKAVEDLLGRITSTINADAELWDIFADFEISLGRLNLVLQCRVRQFRSLLNVPNWEKDEERIKSLTKTAKALTAIHLTKAATRDDLYACASMLSTATRKISVLYGDSEEHKVVTEMQRKVADLHCKLE